MSEQYHEPELLRPKTRARESYLFLLPALVIIGVFTIYPIVWIVMVSVEEFNPMTSTAKWVGLNYFADVLQSAPIWRAVLNTGYFGIIYIPLTLAGSWLVALFLERQMRGRAVLKAILCAPAVMPVVGMALVWRAAYAPVSGSIDRLLYMVGVDHSSTWSGWLNTPYLAMPSIALMCVWRDIGWFSLLFLAALMRTPREFYDMADLDGAGPWQKFIHVRIPACSGAIALSVIILLINTQNLFQEIFVMTEDGGPANWTLNAPFLVYRYVYTNYDWGHAAALSVVLLAISVVFILILNRMLKRRLNWT